MPIPTFNASQLLPEGIHTMTLDECEFLFVQGFPDSSSRAPLFRKFRDYSDLIASFAIHAKQWINGSFVDASRIDPEDIDVVTFISTGVFEALEPDVKSRIRSSLHGGHATKEQFGSHTFMVLVFPADHRARYFSELEISGVRRFWSHAREYGSWGKRLAPDRGAKGFVELIIGDLQFAPDLEPT